jgi:hypothetical protein
VPLGQVFPVSSFDTVDVGQYLPTGHDPQVSSSIAENYPAGQAIADEAVQE